LQVVFPVRSLEGFQEGEEHPRRVTSIGSQAFASCPNLTAVYFQGNTPNVDSSVFNGIHNETVY
jgi:hypothetical protein